MYRMCFGTSVSHYGVPKKENHQVYVMAGRATPRTLFFRSVGGSQSRRYRYGCLPA